MFGFFFVVLTDVCIPDLDSECYILIFGFIRPVKCAPFDRLPRLIEALFVIFFFVSFRNSY